MAGYSHSLSKKFESLRLRIGSLRELRNLVALPKTRDITARQWSVLETQLSVVVDRMLSRLKHAGEEYLPLLADAQRASRFNAIPRASYHGLRKPGQSEPANGSRQVRTI